MSARKIMFLATEDWFFQSHFLALAQRAQDEGYHAVVAARDSGALRDATFRVIDTRFSRGSRTPWDLFREARALAAMLRGERPDIVHAIGLRSIVLLVLSGARGFGLVLAVIGRGYIFARGGVRAALTNALLRVLVRLGMGRNKAVLVVENLSDARWVMGAKPAAMRRVVLMPGAGVDVGQFHAAPEPGAPPYILGVASRLVWSKGIDIAVDAAAVLRARGHDIVLRIAGEPDPENPESVSDAHLAQWRQVPGVELLGRIEDMNAFWSGVHIACLPSRGGEGLPRTLLEAAACGRALVTTNTPGCADFVRDAGCGFAVAELTPAALADGLALLITDQALRRKLAAAGRASVEARYTIAAAADQAAHAWRLTQS